VTGISTPVCPVCSGGSAFKVYDDELNGKVPPVDYAFSPQTRLTYQIVECSDCRHQFVNPLPNLEQLYTDNEDPVYLSSVPQRRVSAHRWLQTVRQYCPLGSRSLIDIGCATGVFLDEAATEFDVEGIELSRWAADFASSRHVIHRRPISELGLKSRFDVATMWGVIEHLENPKKELEAVHRCLRKSGVLFVYTGDRTALLPRLLGKRWWWYQGMHIQYFSRSSLTYLLKECGFTVIDHRRLPVYFSLSSLAQSLNRYRIAKPAVSILRMLKLERTLIRLTLSGEMLLVARRE